MTGPVLLVRPGVLVVLAVAVTVPAVLAAAHVYGRSLPSAVPSRAVELAVAPPWLASAAAVTAALAALAALIVRIASPFPGRRWAPGRPLRPAAWRSDAVGTRGRPGAPAPGRPSRARGAGSGPGRRRPPVRTAGRGAPQAGRGLQPVQGAGQLPQRGHRR